MNEEKKWAKEAKKKKHKIQASTYNPKGHLHVIGHSPSLQIMTCYFVNEMYNGLRVICFILKAFHITAQVSSSEVRIER